MTLVCSNLDEVYNESDSEEEEEEYNEENPRQRRRGQHKKINSMGTIKKKKSARNKKRGISKTKRRKQNWGNGLANFNPPPKPMATSEPDEVKDNFTFEGFDDDEDEHENFTPEPYSGGNTEGMSVKESYVNENSNFYNEGNKYVSNEHYVPNYTQIGDNQRKIDKKDRLMEKLNYMIHMLEEQQDENTSNITEELILYMFLGVFVIFIVDSFSRSKSYER